MKIGSFWAGNPARGLPRHNSTIVLLEQSTGRLGAVIEAGRVNAYRTAAADAVAADLLAREQAKVLAIFGAGNQAGFEVMALARIRPVQAVLVVARPSPRRDAFLERIKELGLNARAVSAEEAVRAADIVVTATPSREPLFHADWVGPGTHVVSMGSDAPGKQELPSELLSRGKPVLRPARPVPRDRRVPTRARRDRRRRARGDANRRRHRKACARTPLRQRAHGLR